MINRRKFIRLSATAGVAVGMPSLVFSQAKQKNVGNLTVPPMIWANLLHLGTNM